MIALVQSYPGGSETLKRHWPHFMNCGASEFVIVTTTDGDCWVPEGIKSTPLGANKYIDGSHLPSRLLDTVEFGLAFDHEHILVAEYDALFLGKIYYKRMEHAIAAHRAGSKTWGSLAGAFYHNPFLFKREAAQRFVEIGRECLGVCTRNRGEASSAESSPDVFLGYVVEKMNQPVQDDLWTEFSRNSLDCEGDLERARQARLDGVTVIHGAKSKAEYDFIMS